MVQVDAEKARRTDQFERAFACYGVGAGGSSAELRRNRSKSPRRTILRRPGRMLGRRPVLIQWRTLLIETRAISATSSNRRRSVLFVIGRPRA